MPGRSHFNLFQYRHSCLFMLCIVLICELYRVVFIIVVQFILLLFNFSFVFCSTFVFIQFFCFFIVHCSLLKEKRLNSDPGLYSRHFNPVVREVPVHHHLCRSNKHHTSDCSDFVLVWERVAYYSHRHSRIYGTHIIQVVKASRGRDSN